MRTPRTLLEIPRRVRNACKGSTIANPDTHSPISRHSIRLCRPDVHGPLVHAGGKPQQGRQISFSPEHGLAGWSGFVSISRERKRSQETRVRSIGSSEDLAAGKEGAEELVAAGIIKKALNVGLAKPAQSAKNPMPPFRRTSPSSCDVVVGIWCDEAHET